MQKKERVKEKAKKKLFQFDLIHRKKQEQTKTIIYKFRLVILLLKIM